MNDASLQQSQVKVLVCASPDRTQPSIIETIEKQLRGQSAFDFFRVDQTSDLTQLIVDAPGALVIFSLLDKEALLEILSFLSRFEPSMSNGTLRVIVINAMNHPKVVSLLKAKGVFDVLDLQTTLKSVSLKIKNSLFMVMRAHQQLVKSESAHVSGTAKTRSETPTVVWEKSEERPEDIWLVTDKKNARFLMGRWLVDVLGPGPSVGIWKASQLQYQNETGWEWCHRPGGDPRFHSDQGRWVFFGKTPEFVWEKTTWAFFGKHARLSFYNHSNTLMFDRFLSDFEQDHRFKIFENSQHAKNLVSIIQSTIDISVRSNDGHTNQKADPLAAISQDFTDLGQVAAVTSGASVQKQNRKQNKIPELSPSFDSLWDLGDLTGLPIDQGHRTFETMSFEIKIVSHNQNILGRAPLVQVVDLLGASVFLEAPSGEFAVGDEITIEAILKRESDQEYFEASGVIRSLEEVSPKKVLLSCEMDPKKVENLERFFNIFSKRQDRLMSFFELAKGA
jgi:hypothetical protein